MSLAVQAALVAPWEGAVECRAGCSLGAAFVVCSIPEWALMHTL